MSGRVHARRSAKSFAASPSRFTTPAAGRERTSNTSVPWVQAKLVVGAPDDPLEHEAERIADAVVSAGPSYHFDQVRVHAAGTSARRDAPNEYGVLHGGHALPPPERMFFEQRLGRDLGGVRLHTDQGAAVLANDLEAQAFTVGSHIAFGAGRYAPNTHEGRHLLAHELVHTLQQGSSAASPGVIQRRPRRQPQGQVYLPRTVGTGARAERSARRTVDAAVRRYFGLGGVGVTDRNLTFQDAATFEAGLSSSALFGPLYTLFLDEGQDHRTEAGHILDFNREPYRIADTDSTRSSLRRFVEAGLARGSFTGQTREYDVTTHAPFPPFTRTPLELVGGAIRGTTDIHPDRRADRTIRVRRDESFHTLVHEIVHFYVHSRFRDMAMGRPDAQDLFRGADRVEDVLLEGFTEYFTQEVMNAEIATLGVPGRAYPAETSAAAIIIMTTGSAQAKNAYFRGIAADVARVSAVVDAYRTTHPDLLIPDIFVP